MTTYLCMGWMSEFNKYFHNYLRVFLLRLSFLLIMMTLLLLSNIYPSPFSHLIDDDILHVTVLATLLLNLLLELLVHLLTAHHVL